MNHSEASVGDENTEMSNAASQTTDAAGTGVLLESFNLTAGGKPLLMNASASFPAGEVTLVLGCSGVGKSLLLRIIAGLISPEDSAIHFSGDIVFRDRDSKATERNHANNPVAVVFQSFALLDELTPVENIEIAIEHSCRRHASRSDVRATAKQLLNDLGVPGDRETSVLSGGQQQRLAIARAVGMETDIVLYDEPTSGLDTNTAAQVAELIRETQTKFQRTSVIVTHDYAALRHIADHVVVLNHHELTLQTVPRSQWERMSELLGTPPEVDHSTASKRSRVGEVMRRCSSCIAACGDFLEQLLALPFTLLPLWKSVRWGCHMTWHYLKLVSGWSACFYIATAGMIIGFVTQDFLFRYLPFRQYTEPLLIENLLHATGFSLYRFLVPILCTILIAARSGAAVAADVGSKVYGNQLDAMKTIGMNPARSVRTPILYAFVVGTPFLTFISYGVASVTSSIAFLATHAQEGIAFWDAHFHHELRRPDSVFYKGTGWLIGKLLMCSLGTAIIAWKCGTSPKRSASEISRGVTQTILWSTLFTLVVHFVFSLVEFTAAK